MKRYFSSYIILFLSLPSLCSAQKIYFTNPTNFWHVEEKYIFASSTPQYFYYDFWYGVDTTVGSTVYKKMLCSDSSRGYVREDTSAGFVFYYNTTNSTEDTLYNYNLKVGDSMGYYVGGTYIIDTIDAIDSVQINGIYNKWFDYSCANCNSYAFARGYSLLDGIGCLSGPLFPTALGACTVGVETRGFYLTCFSENNIAPSFTAYIGDCIGPNSVTNSSTCGPTWINNIQFSGNNLRVYPNPVKEQLTIETNLENSIQEQVRILDISGREVYRSYINESKTEVDMSNFTEGIYFVELDYTNTQGGSMYKAMRKIVKQ